MIGLSVAFGSSPWVRGDDAAGTGALVPMDLVWLGPNRVIVALRDGRALADVDVASGRVARIIALDFAPASLAAVGDDVLIGGMDGELAVWRVGGESRRVGRFGRGQSFVLPLEDRHIFFVSRWSRSAKFVDWSTGVVVLEHAIEDAPGSAIRLPDGRVVVASAFGGKLTRIDPSRSGSARSIDLSGFNLRGLSVSESAETAPEVLIAHQAADSPGPVTRTNIDWGLVLSSKVSFLRASEFDATDRPINIRRLSLDGSRHGAADPSSIAIVDEGRTVLIALAGAHQVLKLERTSGARAAVDLLPLGKRDALVEIPVGRSPVSIRVDATGTIAGTADSMGDSVTLIDIATLATRTILIGGATREPTSAQRGEALFRDGQLAMDRWMSCASCHSEGHTAGRNFDTLGDGTFGNSKNTPSLLGVGETAPFTWTGRFARLSEQVERSLDTTLHGPGLGARQLADLVAYLESLTPPPPPRGPEDPGVLEGAKVFRERRCASCHEPPLMTRPTLKDGGLGDEPVILYNPPSLRGVGWSAPYFHDGRARTLEEAIGRHHPGFGEPPAAADEQALAEYLRSL